MDLIRTASPTISTSSSLDSNGLPHCRIQCNKEKILVGATKYESATDALVAYLNQFDLNDRQSPLISSQNSNESDMNSNNGRMKADVNGKKTDGVQAIDTVIVGSGLVMGPNGLRLEGNKEDVENLLTSKVSPELKEEVTDTLREVKLRQLLKKAAIKSQKQTKTGLQQEVEAALARSAKLLEKVTREDIPSTKAAVSDISDVSISTQALLAVNNSGSDDSILSLESLEPGERKNGHVYSYRQSSRKTIQPTASPVAGSTHRQSRLRTRHASVDNLLASQDFLSPHMKPSSSSSSNSLSNNSDPSDIIRRIRSRSVPPRLHKQHAQPSAQDWLSQLDTSVSKSVPSWVQSMDPSEISDSLWTPKVSPKQSVIPGWVEEVEKSDISIDISAVESLQGVSGMPRLPASPKSSLNKQVKDDLSLSYLGTETEADLSHTTNNHSFSVSLNGSKHVTFGDSELLPGPANPIHSTPISRNLKRNGERYPLRSFIPSKVLDSEFNGEAYLRNSILPQTARLKKSMENFATSTDNLRKSSSSNSSDASSDHRCSSLDTFALLTGKTVSKTETRKPKGNAIFPDSPAISSILPESSQGQLSNGHSSSDGLDGDRPWEAMTNTFKPPVPVGGDGDSKPAHSQAADAGDEKRLSMSLSGGNQPGSMEALKNMLFKLQAEENCVQEAKANPEGSNTEPQPPSSPAALPALQDYNFQMEPGGHSLEKALLHLNRLKTLVKNTAISGKSSPEKYSQENEKSALDLNDTAS